MIVRTAPVAAPAPDAIRAMERLEAQLRRAADDLAETLDAMRAAAAAPLIEVPAFDATTERPDSRCARWMPNVKEPCYRRPGHRDACRSRWTMEEDAANRRTRRAAA